MIGKVHLRRRPSPLATSMKGFRMLRDLFHKTGVESLKIPATITADSNSSSVDLANKQGVILAAHIGNSADTLSGSVYLEVEVEHSDDDSTFTDCADADIFNAVTGTNTGTIAKIDAPAEDSLVVLTGYKGSKRYVRLVFNVTGTHTNGVPVSAVAITQGLREQPANA